MRSSSSKRNICFLEAGFFRIQPKIPVSEDSTIEDKTMDQDLSNLNLDSKDRISDLPDNVLSNILSCLTTKEVVRTCVLSKTWETKWTCILNLRFDDASLYSRRVIDKERFINYVEKILRHCGNSRIEGFTLICSQRYDPRHVTRWISTALRQGVQRFYLDCRSGGLLFPICFWGCKTLEEATLAIPCILKVPPITSFENLKILCIARMTLENENYPHLTELFFTFPILEVFSMFCCTWANVKVIKIEAPRLSSLQVAWCKYGRGPDRLDTCQIQILEARCLTKVKWASDEFLENFVLPRPSSVPELEAILDHFLEIHDFLKAGIRAVKLLKLLSNMIHLELTIDIAEAMDKSGAIAYLPMLTQVIYLKLESRYSGSTRALMSLLRKTPNLRYLEIQTSFAWKNDDYEMIGTLPLCVMYRLRNVYFTYKCGAAIGFYLMRLLLQNAHVLQLMHVRAPGFPSYMKTEIRLLLLLAPRASSNLFIEVE